MGKEIERKFLVKGDGWRASSQGIRYRQGYIQTAGGTTVRIRSAGEVGYVTFKGKTQGMTRSEYEYKIPVGDADEMLELFCRRPLIEKIRYRIPHDQQIWEVDEFLGENHGLIIAEIELTDESQKISLPEWIGEEVTSDHRYFNSNLAQHPFKAW